MLTWCMSILFVQLKDVSVVPQVHCQTGTLSAKSIETGSQANVALGLFNPIQPTTPTFLGVCHTQLRLVPCIHNINQPVAQYPTALFTKVMTVVTCCCYSNYAWTYVAIQLNGRRKPSKTVGQVFTQTNNSLQVKSTGNCSCSQLQWLEESGRNEQPCRVVCRRSLNHEESKN